MTEDHQPSNAGLPLPRRGKGRWEFFDPFAQTRRLIIRTVGIIALVAVAILLLHEIWSFIASPPQEPVSYEPMTSLALQPAVVTHEPGQAVVLDDIEITITSVTVQQVPILTLLGREELSDEAYLVLHVSLKNLSTNQEILLQQPWNEARLTDDRQTRIRRAFTEPAQLDIPQDVISLATLKPGESITDKMIFEWRGGDAASYTLVVAPGFRRYLPSGQTTKISHTSLRFAFDRTAIVMPTPP